MLVFDNMQKVSRWQNVTRFSETLILKFVAQGKTCHDLPRTWHDFGQIFVPI